MRIIGGSRRGKKLLGFDGDDIRPTSDKARAAIFNILAHQSWIDVDVALPSGARVLDLACGTGAFAAECLSRGAVHAILYDNDPRSLKLADQNIRAIDMQGRTKIEFADLTRLPRAESPFDIIFCDPPYKKDLAQKVLSQLQRQNYMHDKTILMLETGKDEKLEITAPYELLDSRAYGAAKIWFVKLA